MKNLFTFLIILLFFDNEIPALTFNYNGIERTYFVYVPKCYNNVNKTPLVVALHGGGGLAKKMISFTRFDEISERENFIVLYPQGYERQWNDGREAESISAQRQNIDDVGFIDSLISYMCTRYNIDTRRIYVTGASNGGFMSTRLGCELSDKIAAISPMISTFPKAFQSKCHPSAPMPVMLINGTEDPLVPYEGGEVKVGRKTRGAILSTDETISFWVKNNQCSSEPESKQIKDSDKTDNCFATEFIYPNKHNNADVILIKVTGGGHTIPGGKQYLPKGIIGTVCKDFVAEELIWEFFKRQSR